MSNQLWGEIPEKQERERVGHELAKMVIFSAIKPEGPKVKKTLCDMKTTNLIPAEYSRTEVYVAETIQLIQHSRQVKELIRKLGSPPDEEESDETKECPPLPVLTYRESKQKINYPFRNVEFEESPFTKGISVNLPELGARGAKELLFKSVSALLAHAGYDSAMNSALQALTDIAEDFLRKITRRLRHAKDAEDTYGPTGFPDIMERVFFEMGLGSVTSLHDFYQTRIIAYREEKKLECLKLMEEYKQCSALPHTKSPDDPVMRIKKELEDDDDIPEIHFPALGDGDGVDELQPSLEHGFQMLHSLEQEVQMQSNLDQEDEDVNVSDSPQGSEVALSFQPGSEAWIAAIKSKKRKRK